MACRSTKLILSDARSAVARARQSRADVVGVPEGMSDGTADARVPPEAFDADGDDVPTSSETAIARRAPEPFDHERDGRDKPRGGGIISLVSRWKPHKTPRFTLTVVLYLLGLFLAFAAKPPVTVTPAMQDRYFAKMEVAESADFELRARAEREYARARRETNQANGFMCFANERCRKRVDGLKRRERELLAEAKEHREKRDALVREAKSELGLWSSLGVEETKSLFRKAYEDGKVYATRTSYYDTFWLILAGRSDDSLIELLLRWGMQVLANFTVGMVSAVLHFAWGLPSLIRTFGASAASAVCFYGIAVLSATSVAFSLLLLLFGTAGGVAYGVVAAAPELARLEQSQRAAERRRLSRDRRGGWGHSRNQRSRLRDQEQDAHLD